MASEKCGLVRCLSFEPAPLSQFLLGLLGAPSQVFMALTTQFPVSLFPVTRRGTPSRSLQSFFFKKKTFLGNDFFILQSDRTHHASVRRFTSRRIADGRRLVSC